MTTIQDIQFEEFYSGIGVPVRHRWTCLKCGIRFQGLAREESRLIAQQHVDLDCSQYLDRN